MSRRTVVGGHLRSEELLTCSPVHRAKTSTDLPEQCLEHRLVEQAFDRGRDGWSVGGRYSGAPKNDS